MFKTTAKFTPKPQQISRIFWFFKKGVIKHFAKSTGRNTKTCTFIQKEALTHMCSIEFSESFLKRTFAGKFISEIYWQLLINLLIQSVFILW